MSRPQSTCHDCTKGTYVGVLGQDRKVGNKDRQVRPRPRELHSGFSDCGEWKVLYVENTQRVNMHHPSKNHLELVSSLSFSSTEKVNPKPEGPFGSWNIVTKDGNKVSNLKSFNDEFW